MLLLLLLLLSREDIKDDHLDEDVDEERGDKLRLELGSSSQRDFFLGSFLLPSFERLLLLPLSLERLFLPSLYPTLSLERLLSLYLERLLLLLLL